jgi:hypothetical protein
MLHLMVGRRVSIAPERAALACATWPGARRSAGRSSVLGEDGGTQLDGQVPV